VISLVVETLLLMSEGFALIPDEKMRSTAKLFSSSLPKMDSHIYYAVTERDNQHAREP